MENLFIKLGELFAASGCWAIPLIALVGIIILGILKYCDCFKKIDEKYRHYVYLAISLAFSIGGCAIYIAITKQPDFWNVLLPLSVIIWGLNQAAYNLFKITPIKELFAQLCDLIADILRRSNKKEIAEEKKEEK